MLPTTKFTPPFYITLWCPMTVTQIIEIQLILLNWIQCLLWTRYPELFTSIQGVVASARNTWAYPCLVCLLMPPLLISLGCWLAWISQRAWRLPSRDLIISSSSVTPWKNCLHFHCFLVSSTCSIYIWDDNASCKSMLKSNALITFKLLWNWFINALKSVADSLLITGNDNNDFTWTAAIKRSLLYLTHSKFQATWISAV